MYRLKILLYSIKKITLYNCANYQSQLMDLDLNLNLRMCEWVCDDVTCVHRLIQGSILELIIWGRTVELQC